MRNKNFLIFFLFHFILIMGCYNGDSSTDKINEKESKSIPDSLSKTSTSCVDTEWEVTETIKNEILETADDESDVNIINVNIDNEEQHIVYHSYATCAEYDDSGNCTYCGGYTVKVIDSYTTTLKGWYEYDKRPCRENSFLNIEYPEHCTSEYCE